MKTFRKSKWFIPVIAILAAVLITGAVVAAWSTSCPIGGKGTITVPNGTHATHGIQLLTSASDLDFSGSFATPDGGMYTKTITVQVKNTGTDGTGYYSGESATITAIVAGGAPSGFITSTDWTGTLAVGATSALNITLKSINPVTTTTVLPAFMISVSGSGS